MNPETKQNLTTVTPLSKLLAMLLFVALPFIGLYIGYTFAPEKVVEVERLVIKEMSSTSTDVTTLEDAPTSLPIFPVVAYEREGLLTDSEREELERKFINPQIDYYRDPFHNGEAPLTMAIEIPRNIGDEYVVRSVFLVDNRAGTGGYLYGVKGSDLPYWKPDCFKGCLFSEEYQAKYPELVAEYNNAIRP